MVEDGGVWRVVVVEVVVCGRCEDIDDGIGVCMSVGWWVTHMALVPCASKHDTKHIRPIRTNTVGDKQACFHAICTKMKTQNNAEDVDAPR